MSTLTLSYRRYADRPWQPTASHLVTLLSTWYQRSRQRRQLAELSEAQLRDVAISPAQALAESAKPFWQS
jgi:uncharacterized protein YjiS (DUF1127 family)